MSLEDQLQAKMEAAGAGGRHACISRGKAKAINRLLHKNQKLGFLGKDTVKLLERDLKKLYRPAQHSRDF